MEGCFSGMEALAMAGEWAPHLVLSDITMGGMSGVELLGILRRRYPDTRVVLITGFGTIELAVEAMRRGASHFISKPFDNEEVLQAVSRYGYEALIREKARQLVGPQEDGEPVIIAEDPLTCVARGGGKALELMDAAGNADLLSTD